MKKLACLIVVILCAGCGGKKDPEIQNPCRDGLIYQDGMCLCGAEQLTPAESTLWDCFENAHYLCLRSEGCPKGEIRYPTWSHFAESLTLGDKNLPPVPKNPKGYLLTLNRDGSLEWTCFDRDCVCGKGIIHGYNHEICRNESFEAHEQADCGDEKCTIKNGICRDGKCWCDNTWQGPESAKYGCEEHSVYGKAVLEDGDCKNYPELCDYIRARHPYKHDLICQSENGCACGSNTCQMGTICRQDKCWCSDIDLSQYEDVQNYECTWNVSEHAMICASENGCKCGDHRIVKGSECIDGKQVCHRAVVDWVDETLISQYVCDDLHPMIVCNNPKGCKCDRNTCLQGASCIAGECVCGNQYRLPFGVFMNKEQYICEDGEYVCNRDKGCDCDEDKCVKGSTCDNGQCSCGEYINTTVSRFSRFECVRGEGGDQPALYCGNDAGCKGYYKDNTDYRSDDNENEDKPEIEKICEKDEYYSEYFGCDYEAQSPYRSVGLDNAGFIIGDERYSYYQEERPYELRVNSCRDCDQFSLYEYYDDGSCMDVWQRFTCKVNGGCVHDNKYYSYGMDIDAVAGSERIPPAVYAGFPDKKNITPQSGEAVAVCNHIYPLGVLKTYLKNGTITEIRDTWVCDDDQCACGSQTCHMGDLCQGGKCSPYQGCSIRIPPDKVVYYCHDANQKPIPRPDDSEDYLCRGNHPDLRGDSHPQQKDEGDHHWYCNKSKCVCGDHTCPQNSYCEDGACYCGGKPIKEGFLCQKGMPVCNSSSCSCGGEPLREGYTCRDDRQLCSTEEGCICGNQMIRFEEMCDHGVEICASNGNNPGCRCGDKALPKGYICKDSQFVCDEDSCICGTKQCGRGDTCDNGVCKCGENAHQGCLCGSDVVQNVEHYRCIDQQLVCWPDGIGDTNHYPEGLPDCACGGSKIPVGAVCKDGNLCEDCEYKIAMRDKDGYFHKTCDFKGQKLNITYEYVADCYPNTNDDSGWRNGYICEDDTEYYSLYTIDPCDCLAEYNAEDAPIRQEELDKYYCSITQYYEQDCSERTPKEEVERWEPIHSEDSVNLCEEAESRDITIIPDWDAHTCACGSDTIPMDEAKNYQCDLGLRWRCNREEGCACGNAACRKSQICLKSGECSR